MKINGAKLTQELIAKENQRIKDMSEDDALLFIDGYSSGVADAIELIINQVDDQLKELEEGK